MLYFQINPHSGVPVYRQLMDQVRFHVSGGSLKAGDQLPSIRELARQLSLNPTTIAKAYEQMAKEGLVEKQPGRGAFVADIRQQLDATEREDKLRQLARQLAVEAHQLGSSYGTILRLLGEEMDRLKGEEK